MKIEMTKMEWEVVLSYLADAYTLHTRHGNWGDVENVELLSKQISYQVNNGEKR